MYFTTCVIIPYLMLKSYGMVTNHNEWTYERMANNNNLYIAANRPMKEGLTITPSI